MSPRGVRYSRGVRLLPKKLLRDSLDNQPDYSRMEWHERLFEEFRAWLIMSDRRAHQQNFFKRNIGYIVAGFFILVWVFIYLSYNGMPEVNVDDLQMCIPKRYRDPYLEDMRKEPERTYTPSKVMGRLASEQPAVKPK